jgi:hypothetical protein
MKAIDLYIATEKNEKVPDIVFYNFHKYRYYPNENNYYREENCDLISLFLDAKPDDIIYLLEDTPKKIEKLTDQDLDPNCLNVSGIIFRNKINEIIDKVNGEDNE